MRRDRFEKDGAAREHRRPEREMPDASEMHRIAQDFAEVTIMTRVCVVSRSMQYGRRIL